MIVVEVGNNVQNNEDCGDVCFWGEEHDFSNRRQYNNECKTFENNLIVSQWGHDNRDMVLLFVEFFGYTRHFQADKHELWFQ